MTFGKKLQQLRLKEGLSQDKLAEILEVSRQAVSKWERDETMPETEKVIRISEIFHVSIDYLLKDQEEQPVAPKPDEGSMHDFFNQLLQLFKSKGYFLGYGLIVWGLLDFIQIIMVRAIWGTMTSFVGNAGDVIEVSGVVNAPLNVLWLSVIYGIAKIIGGAAVVYYGKRYAKKGVFSK